MVKVKPGRDAAPAVIWPAPVLPGDWIAVVAPSSPFGAEDYGRGMAWLREHYRVKVAADVLDRAGYLAGSDDRRAAELERMIRDPDVGAIVAARGGYGAMRILERLPWRELEQAPKWIVGFSDVTALHACAWSRGLASIHAPHVTGLGRADSLPSEREAWQRALESPRAPRAWERLRVLRAGEARGVLVGGNLALVETMAASGRLALPDGCVLALEDVTERPYRVDRMLTALRLGGHLARASAIVFGSFEQCDPGPDGVTVDEVIAERTGDLGVPVLAGAPFGHGASNEPFILGSTAHVSGDSVLMAG